MGKPIDYAIKQLQIDTSEFTAIEEPPGILDGIRITIGDSCKIDLYVDHVVANKKGLIKKYGPQASFRVLYLPIEHKKIIAIRWEKLKTNSILKSNHIGE